jgi:NAD(P)-dependent dehydrogenase (short-subunit alcohol dehydrogenase family)
MIPPDFSVAGLRVLVTGSTRGIGAAIAQAFLAGGATVFVHGRTIEACRKFTETHGGLPAPGDLASRGGPAEIVRAVHDAGGSLDTLIHNAGFEAYLPLASYDMDTFDRILRVNLRAPVELTHLLLPALRRSTNASVINVTSIHESAPSPNNSAYSMAKAALAMFTKCLAVELGPLGLRSNTIAPGAIETDMNRAIIDATGRDNWREWIPAGRVGTAEEIAGAALFLASPAARYMNGGCLVIDGGYSHNLVRYRHTE